MRPRVFTGIGRTAAVRHADCRRTPGRHHGVLVEIGLELVVRQGERLADEAVDPQLPLLRRDLGDGTVVAGIERIERGDGPLASTAAGGSAL